MEQAGYDLFSPRSANDADAEIVDQEPEQDEYPYLGFNL
jgi:hypothetical protein